MYSRHRFNFSFGDLAASAWYTLTPRTFTSECRQLESERSTPAKSCVVSFSVRSMVDALLTVLDLPAGSEILMTELNIADMGNVIRAHDVTIVPVAVDSATLAPSRTDLEAALTPNTRALLVAHLFGGTVDLEECAAFAREHNLLLIEDCAQALTSAADRGSDLADISLYSFGPVKTASSLGGALTYFRDAALASHVQALQQTWPMQSRPTYFKRLGKYAVFKACLQPTLFGAILWCLRKFGVEIDTWLNSITRSFGSDTQKMLEKIRCRPSAPLVASLRRRLRRFPAKWIRERKKWGDEVVAALPSGSVLGYAQSNHTHWYFPWRADDPDGAIERLQRRAFDATHVRATNVVSYLDDSILENVIMLPVYPSMGRRARKRLLRELAAVTKSADRSAETDRHPIGAPQ